MPSFYQDRLGTNIGKALKKEWLRFLRKRASLSLACILPHFLKLVLKPEGSGAGGGGSAVASLQELLPALLAGGGAPLAALRYAYILMYIYAQIYMHSKP
eukprot:COSAG06_NODE_222_length_19858_cov_7.238372_5_plen_100_part_00